MANGESPDLSEDQQALQDTLRGFLTDQLSPAMLRRALETDAGYDPQLHARLAGEFGLAGLTIPEEFGGRGMSLPDAVVVHAELGRALYPGPLLASSLAAGVLQQASAAEAAGRWLPRLAEGSVNGAVAAAGEAGHWAPGSDSVRAERTPQGWRLSGQRWYVVAAHVASVVAVPARIDSGLGMFLVEAGASGYSASRQLGLDLTRRMCVTTFDAAPAGLLGQHEAAVAALGRAEREFLIATAAEAAGGIGWCVDAAIEYAKDREQSGSPNGSFGSVVQACADMLTDFQAVLAAARYAAVAEGASDAPMTAHVAALKAGEAYRRATESAVHLFGGAGSAREHDADLHYRRAWSAERLAGGPRAHRAAIADGGRGRA
jgi:alkylation response protein AidB-like acyl-CoA dehydrogenase